MVLGRRHRDPNAGSERDPFTLEALALLDHLYATALRLTRNIATAEDLVQETYLKAFRARARFTAGTNLKAWVFTILHNTWRNRQRDTSRSRVDYDSEAVERMAEGMTQASPVAETPESLLLDKTLDVNLRCALDSLPEAYREAVWLRDVEGLSYQEIATVVEVPIGTVMSRISRGRKQLFDLLSPTAREEVPHRVSSKGV